VGWGILVALACNLFWLTPATAQVSNGRVVRTANDTGDCVLRGALVTFNHREKGWDRTTKTNSESRTYLPANMASYFHTSLSQPSRRPGESTADRPQVWMPWLKLASQSDEVIVTAETPSGEAAAINIE
jgi:hypothetical protein